MKFDLSEDQELLRSSTVDFLAAESPVTVSRALAETPGEGFSRAHWKKLAELGYLGLVVSGHAGGQGMGAIELAIVCEQMGKVCHPGPFRETVLAAALLDGAKGHENVVGEIVRGDSIVVPATIDRVWPNDEGTTRFSNGHISGTKYFVAYGAYADRLVVSTRDGWVLADGPFQCEPMETIDEAARFSRVMLDNSAEPITPPGSPLRMSGLSDVATAADALGVCQWAMDASIAYAKERRTFGKPIGTYQVLQHRMADMLVRTESTRAAVYRAAWLVTAADTQAPLACSSARAYAVESAGRITRETVQIHGGNGFTWEYDVHRFLKRAMTLAQHGAGASDALDRALDAFVAAG